jgi:hypothetical protein
VDPTASKVPDEQGSEHRAQAWAALGAALVGLGTVGAGTLATVGASAHLWGHDIFLTGFAFACLLLALGGYVLVAEFLGGLPLPLTRRERDARRRQAETLEAVPGDGASPPVKPSPHPGPSLSQPVEERVVAIEQQRELVVREANKLLRMIVEAELQAKDTLACVNERRFYNFAAEVEAWARRVGCADEVPKYGGNVAADLPRLRVFVQTQLERWRDEQGLSTRPKTPR